MKKIFLSAVVLLFAFGGFASEKLKASFKADKQSGMLPLSVTFEGVSETEEVSYNWNFGNGNYSMKKATTELFVNPGTYTVKLMVSNGVETDSSFMSIEVLPNPDIMNMFRAKPTAEE